MERDPRVGLSLGNKAGIDLEGYFKLYADKKRIRIVYHVVRTIARQKVLEVRHATG